MQILLVRHGQAVETAPGLGDSGRWLTAKGRRITRKVARWLDKNDRRRPTAIWTSPLVRAVQTAEIVAARTGFEGEIRAVSELSPGRDPGDLVKLLVAEPMEGVLALVGHEPSLSLIANALAGEPVVESLRKSGVLGLGWDGVKGTPRFLLDPADMKPKKRFGAAAPAAPDAAADEA